MSDKTMQQNGKAWLKAQTGKYTASVVFLSLLSAFGTGFSLAFAFLVRYLINSAAANNRQSIWIFSAVLLAVLLLKIIINTLAHYLAERLRARITAELRTSVFGKLLRSDYAQLQGYHSGELLNRLTSDIQEVATDTVGLLPALVGMVVQAAGAIAALLFTDPLFTAIYVVGGCVFGSITALFRKQIKKQQKQVLEADGASRSFMQEGVASVLTLKAYGAEEKTKQKAGGLAETYYQKRMQRNRLNSWMKAMFSLLGNFGLIFAIIWCSISVLNQQGDYGSMLSVVLLLMQLQQPFTSFSSWVPIYYARITSGERLYSLDAIPCEMIVEEGMEDNTADFTQAIGLDEVDFTYGRTQILSKASISIKKGEIVCVTGASGAGKSTLFKLLLNVLQPNAGRLWRMGKDGEKTPLTAKNRRLFAYVPQGKFLFSGTIYENLTFFTGEDEGIEERIINALKVACAEFVFDLPQGLQTPLGENGTGLSEGQMQRLAVARAIVSDRPILLLDEATSALDGETEQRLLENIRALQDKTCLIVTHRPAALAIADTIISVEDGKIITQYN